MEMDFVKLDTAETCALAARAFENAGALQDNAAATAQALLQAEIDGQIGHGLGRVPSYVAQLETGKVNPIAVPEISDMPDKACIRVDAGYGFCYRAVDMAIEALAPLASRYGIASAYIRKSHHFGQAGAHAEKLAQKGFVALAFGNSPKGIAFWGSHEPAMGTNPIAFAAPMRAGPPLLIDLAVSVAARGKILAAEKAGQPIPAGWALDAEGQPTTDPAAALAGSMQPIGDAKGAALAMMVEILAAALTGSHFGFEASSLFTGEGPPPDLGHMLIAIDPDIGSEGAFWDRMAVLVSQIDLAEGARLPGQSRLERRAQVASDGLRLAKPLYAELTALAGGVSGAASGGVASGAAADISRARSSEKFPGAESSA